MQCHLQKEILAKSGCYDLCTCIYVIIGTGAINLSLWNRDKFKTIFNLWQSDAFYSSYV